MNGLVVPVQCRFAQGFTHRGVRFDPFAEVFDKSLQTHRRGSLADQVGCVGAEDVDTQDLSALWITDDLDEAFGFAEGVGRTAGLIGKSTHPNSQPCCLGLLLRETDGTDFSKPPYAARDAVRLNRVAHPL